MTGLTTFSGADVYHRGMDVIYLDELFALNALVDYLLLRLAARLARLDVRRGRTLWAASVGGWYALGAAVWPWLRSGAAEIAASLLLALTAFGPERALWRGWGAFLTVSALFAGAAYAGALLSGVPASPGAVPARLSVRVLLVAFGICWAGMRSILLCLDRQKQGAAQRVELTLAGRQATLLALRDTGNSLLDPISGAAVMVAEASALSPLLGVPLVREDTADSATLYRRLSALPALAGRLRLVPFTSVGSSGGMLVCFRPDRVLIDGAPAAALVAIAPHPLGGEGFNAVF